jgi:hypothetical protein
MARISSYPIDATPTLSDKVVGSDVNDLNATKNYTIGDILSLSPFNTLSATKMWYGNALSQPVETSALTYVAGGLGTVPNDTIAFNGATLLGDFTSINDDTSIVLGRSAVNIPNASNNSIYLGVQAGGNATVTYINNVVIGYQAQYYQVNARESVAIGHQSMMGTATWNGKATYYNTAVGTGTLKNLSDTNAGTDNNHGNTAIGAFALTNLKNQLENIGIGYNAGFSLETNNRENVVIGSNALNNNSISDSFDWNTVIGSRVGRNTVNGNIRGTRWNTAMGFDSFTVAGITPATTFEGAEQNTFIGYNAGANLQPQDALLPWSVTANTVLGSRAYISSGGDYNIAVGFEALADSHGDHNIAIGREAGGEFRNGDDNNISIGSFAEESATLLPAVKQQNIAIGNTTRQLAQGGIHNIAIGFESQKRNSGQGNITVGGLSMNSTSLNYTGSFNVGVGYGVLSMTGNGEYNTAVGNDAGFDIVSGSFNTAVGKGAGNSLPNAINTTCLGNEATAFGDNEVVLGNPFVTTLRCNTPVISGVSDQRDKTNIQPLGLGIDFLMDLNPVSWDWDRRDESMQGYKDVGFVAQELDSVRSQYSVEDILHKLVDKTNPDQYWAAPSVLIPVLVKAIQELKAEINELKNGTN